MKLIINKIGFETSVRQEFRGLELVNLVSEKA